MVSANYLRKYLKAIRIDVAAAKAERARGWTRPSPMVIGALRAFANDFRYAAAST